jgi:hypothetical protein
VQEILPPPSITPFNRHQIKPDLPTQLIQTLQHGNDRERNHSAIRLREFNQSQVITALLDAVKYDWKVRYEALLSLYELKSKSALNTFVERLEDPSPRIRYVSILALGEIGEPSDVESLQKLIDTDDFSLMNRRRGEGKGRRTNWGRSENVLAAKNAILSMQKRLKLT